jgi:hypothetical protein
MPLAEVRDRAEVRWIARHDHHEVRPLHRRPGDPPRRIQPARVRMQKQPRHHLRVERRLAKFARVAAGDLAQIEALSDQENNQPGQVVLSHVILNARRQQRRLVNLPGPKVLAHGRAKNQTRRNLASDYSDRLLVEASAIRQSRDHVALALSGASHRLQPIEHGSVSG